MNKKLKIGIIVTSVILLIALLITAYIVSTNISKNYVDTNISEEDSVSEDSSYKAPELLITDASGKTYTLDDFKGKPVVINFWASWCPPCKSEMPNFQEVYSEVGDEVQFLMVSLVDGSKETKETADQFIEENKYTFPVYYDENNTSAINYGISSIPTTILIDEDGNVVDKYIGALSKSYLEALLQKIR